MNQHIPNATELMIKRLLQFVGIKPEQILEPLSQIRDIAVDANNRLARIEAKVDALSQQRISDGTSRNEPTGGN